MQAILRKLPYNRRYRFFTKLFLSYLLLCTVPTLIITNVFYSKAKEQIITTSAQFVEMLAAQLSASLDTYIAQVNNSSLTMYSDYELIDYLGKELTYSAADRIKYNLHLNSQLSTLMTQLPNLQGVSLISGSGTVNNIGFFPDMSHNRAFWDEWLKKIREANGQLVIVPAHSQVYLSTGNADTVFSAGRLIQDIEGRQAGILLFQLTINKIVINNEKLNNDAIPFNKRIFIELSQPRGLMIYDSEAKPASFAPHSLSPILPEELWMQGADDNGKLTVKVAVPTRELDKQIGSYRNLAFMIAAITVFAIAFISMLLSYQISAPINRLIRNMRQVEEGRYTPLSEEGLNIEIETLTRTYNLMILKIKHLIEDVYLSQIKQNQAKFLALQNQINPHWLNNTLESIRMQAYLSKAPDIATMIKTLGRMFQLTLAQSEQPNRIADELEYLQVYMNLQNIRFENRFRLVILLPEPIMRVSIVKLVFQPIVENCIEHGFVDPDRDYEIRIEGDLTEHRCSLRIMDNGGGMNPDQLAEVRKQLRYPDWSEASKEHSLGLRNIQERLQLQYSQEFGLEIDSIPDAGTTVTIHVPFIAADAVLPSKGDNYA